MKLSSIFGVLIISILVTISGCSGGGGNGAQDGALEESSEAGLSTEWASVYGLSSENELAASLTVAANFSGNSSIIGDPVFLDLQGKVLDTPCILAMAYRDDELPAGVAAEDLFLAKLVEGNWVTLSSSEAESLFDENSIDDLSGDEFSATAKILTANEKTGQDTHKKIYAQIYEQGTYALMPPVGKIPPMIASLEVSPTHIPANEATAVTFSWLFKYQPTSAVTCVIDGIGIVESGKPVMLTLSDQMQYVLEFTSDDGNTAAEVNLGISVAPQIDSFKAGPRMVDLLSSGTDVTWTWGYANSPVPEPACEVSRIGNIANGETASVYLPGVYELTCSNNAGSDAKEIFIGAATGISFPVVTIAPEGGIYPFGPVTLNVPNDAVPITDADQDGEADSVAIGIEFMVDFPGDYPGDYPADERLVGLPVRFTPENYTFRNPVTLVVDYSPLLDLGFSEAQLEYVCISRLSHDGLSWQPVFTYMDKDAEQMWIETSVLRPHALFLSNYPAIGASNAGQLPFTAGSSDAAVQGYQATQSESENASEQTPLTRKRLKYQRLEEMALVMPELKLYDNPERIGMIWDDDRENYDPDYLPTIYDDVRDPDKTKRYLGKLMPDKFRPDKYIAGKAADLDTVYNEYLNNGDAGTTGDDELILLGLQRRTGDNNDDEMDLVLTVYDYNSEKRSGADKIQEITVILDLSTRESGKGTLDCTFINDQTGRETFTTDSSFYDGDIATGDTDGDGRQEIIVVGSFGNMTDKRYTPYEDKENYVLWLLEYNPDNGGFDLIWQKTYTGEHKVRDARVDAGDIDGDGKDEIVLVLVKREAEGGGAKTRVQAYCFQHDPHKEESARWRYKGGYACFGLMGSRNNSEVFATKATYRPNVLIDNFQREYNPSNGNRNPDPLEVAFMAVDGVHAWIELYNFPAEGLPARYWLKPREIPRVARDIADASSLAKNLDLNCFESDRVKSQLHEFDPTLSHGRWRCSLKQDAQDGYWSTPHMVSGDFDGNLSRDIAFAMGVDLHIELSKFYHYAGGSAKWLGDRVERYFSDPEMPKRDFRVIGYYLPDRDDGAKASSARKNAPIILHKRLYYKGQIAAGDTDLDGRDELALVYFDEGESSKDDQYVVRQFHYFREGERNGNFLEDTADDGGVKIEREGFYTENHLNQDNQKMIWSLKGTQGVGGSEDGTSDYKAFPLVVFGDYDGDNAICEYTGESQYWDVDPSPIAVLAMPPHVREWTTGTKLDNTLFQDSGSVSLATASSIEKSKSKTSSKTYSISFGQEFEDPIGCLGGAHWKATFGQEFENTETTTEAITQVSILGVDYPDYDAFHYVNSDPPNASVVYDALTVKSFKYKYLAHPHPKYRPVDENGNGELEDNEYHYFTIDVPNNGETTRICSLESYNTRGAQQGNNNEITFDPITVYDSEDGEIMPLLERDLNNPFDYPVSQALYQLIDQEVDNTLSIDDRLAQKKKDPSLEDEFEGWLNGPYEVRPEGPSYWNTSEIEISQSEAKEKAMTIGGSFEVGVKFTTVTMDASIGYNHRSARTVSIGTATTFSSTVYQTSALKEADERSWYFWGMGVYLREVHDYPAFFVVDFWVDRP